MIRQFPRPHDPLDAPAEDTPLVKLWYAVLTEALNGRFEQLHLLLPRNSRTFTILRRAGGSWQTVMEPTAKMYAAFLQRLKIMAGFSLAKRLPVERGRFRFESDGAVFEIDVTVRSGSDGSEDALIDLPAHPLTSED